MLINKTWYEQYQVLLNEGALDVQAIKRALKVKSGIMVLLQDLH